MAKKGSRPNKPNQQKTREEQWRRRAAAQTGGATSVAEVSSSGRYSGTLDDTADYAETEVPSSTVTAATRTATPRATQTRTQSSTASIPASQRRSSNLPRQSRARYTPNVMSLEDEMYYVRSDIRRLILLTAACVAVLIALYFIIPK